MERLVKRSIGRPDSERGVKDQQRFADGVDDVLRVVLNIFCQIRLFQHGSRLSACSRPWRPCARDGVDGLDRWERGGEGRQAVWPISDDTRMVKGSKRLIAAAGEP